MRVSVFTHAEHYLYENRLYSYGPYVKEMNYWISEFEEVKIIAPLSEKGYGNIDLAYQHSNIEIKNIPALHYKKNSLFRNFKKSLRVFKSCFKEMKRADHIHLRCPGNVGMLAMIISSLFPSKPKTIKYAGNWDPESEQPLSYRFQKWWLSNTILTKRAKVLVYGEWKNQSKNIVPFFTASFSSKENSLKYFRVGPPFQFLFCGSLVIGKDPMWALKVVHLILNYGFEVTLDFYGDGPEYQNLKDYVHSNFLNKVVTFHGNQKQEILKEAYRNSHFCILPSVSEGWPKVLAEAMFFGCIPISTKVSCIPWMLDHGKRGILIDKLDMKEAARKIEMVISDQILLENLRCNSQTWSRKFTLERFQVEIQKLI